MPRGAAAGAGGGGSAGRAGTRGTWRDRRGGGCCGGSTSGGTSGGTTTGGTTTGGTTGGGGTIPATGPIHTAPYVDMGAWPTPSLTTTASSSGLKGFTLAFVTSAGCKASWFNAYDPRQARAKDEIDALRAAGGDVKISFGGASGIDLAQACTSVDALTAEYAAVVDAYGLNYADFDIEGAAVAEPASIAVRSQALAKLQQTHPGLRISLTLPVLPEGLTSDGLNVVSSAINAGRQPRHGQLNGHGLLPERRLRRRGRAGGHQRGGPAQDPLLPGPVRRPAVGDGRGDADARPERRRQRLRPGRRPPARLLRAEQAPGPALVLGGGPGRQRVQRRPVQVHQHLAAPYEFSKIFAAYNG